MFLPEKIASTIKFMVLVSVLSLVGCAGSVKNMREVSPEEVVDTPEEGKALIVFMRPSTLGFAIQSSVFEVDGATAELAGIVAAKKKVAYQVDPGEHLFMVIGESADFMTADVEAGKTYYALVTPRMGMWKARFSLKPIHKDELDSTKLADWKESCEWVEIGPESDNWAMANMNSIQSKRAEYYKDWLEKDEEDRPRLLPQDGE